MFLILKKWPVRTIVSPVSYDKLFDQTNIKFKKKKKAWVILCICIRVVKD